jgi:phage terminase large subunit-like protein
VVSGKLCHGDDPILGWMASNTVLIQSGTIKRLAKERSPEKIDGFAALVMGVDGAIIKRSRRPEPSYQMFVYGGR